MSDDHRKDRLPVEAATTRKLLRYEIPSTVSSEAKNTLGAFYQTMEQSLQLPQVSPTTQAEWDERNALIGTFIGPAVQNTVDMLGVAVREDEICGVPVLRVTPPGYRPRNRTLLYIHGGGYVVLSARTTLTVPALIAVASGDEVISIDYTLAPRSTWRQTTDQVIAVYREILENRQADRIAIFGDSAGGGLAAGSILKMRDADLPLPGALYLLSPWSDVTDAGDTYATLADADPTLNMADLKHGADVYAAPADQKNPYVSPVYGDFTRPFPPTLIQGGTREIFVSNFVRQYQAIRGGGHEAVLDLYEGMPHVFQGLVPTAPETQTAIKRAADFFDAHLARP